MFKDSTIANVFPVPVWIQMLEEADRARLDQALIGLLERERQAAESYKPGGHWQSRNDLQSDPLLGPFCDVAKAAAAIALDSLSAKPGEVQVTGCWFNLQPPGGVPHDAHTHPNNFLSGVYYLRAGPGADAIVFHDPRPQTNIIMPRYDAPNAYNSRRATVTIRPGTLILFPAYLSHSVPPNGSDEERVSLSFNLMFANFTETVSPPKWHFAGPDDPR